MRVLVIVVAFLLMALLTVMVKKPKWAKPCVTGQDIEAAAFMGIDTDRIIVWCSSSAPPPGNNRRPGGTPLPPSRLLCGLPGRTQGFTAAVLGGIGNIFRAMLGPHPRTLESLATILPQATKDVVAFIVLILVLIFGPWGLMGERSRKKSDGAKPLRDELE
jgi:branched-chain amino acid transport system permease protein